jgi:hypothetical protein
MKKQTDMMKVIVAFCNFTNTLKNNKPSFFLKKTLKLGINNQTNKEGNELKIGEK